MSELNDLYQEVIIDHSMHPHNYHAMADASRKAEGYNPLCGDQVTVYLKLDGDKIQDVSFEGRGCAISKASASVMTEVLKDKTRQEAEGLFQTFHKLITEDKPAADEAELGKLAAFSGVHEFPTRVKCAILAWHTLRSALEAKKGTVTTE
jgi:nitrogen fixation protein NifU and related proteins